MELLQALEMHTNFLPPVEEFENLEVDHLLKRRISSQSEPQVFNSIIKQWIKIIN